MEISSLLKIERSESVEKFFHGHLQGSIVSLFGCKLSEDLLRSAEESYFVLLVSYCSVSSGGWDGLSIFIVLIEIHVSTKAKHGSENSWNS